MKPSNFKKLINNRITQGKLKTEIEVFLNDKGLIENFIARGKIKNLKAKLTNSLSLTNTNFGFTADKNDILLKNIFGDVENIKILEGDVRLNFEQGVKLNSNFFSQINLNSEVLNKHSQLFEKFKFLENIKIFKANFNNSLSFELDKTYKITNYNYKVTGKLDKQF